MHWADAIAARLPQRRHVMATGITPSGPIHVGNLREVLTTEAVYRAARDRGLEAELLYIGDSFDPLRKRYPFLPESYEAHVGKPLSTIPCPCGAHASYAQHFLEPFLGALSDLGIQPRIHSAHELYAGGAYRGAIARAFERRLIIKGILETTAGRALPETWIPFSPLCPNCGRFVQKAPDEIDGTRVRLACACGFADWVDCAEPGAGKLPWRVDWPARWSFLGVTFESFGKDHAAAGGSWDTGVPISERVFEYPPPAHAVYEFIHLKGVGAMHSSTGTAIPATDVLEAVPPEVLRFAILRHQPNVHVDFDPAGGLPALVDEFDRWLAAAVTGEEAKDMKDGRRTVHLSMPDGAVPDHAPRVPPFKHIALLVQIHGPDGTWEALERIGAVEPQDKLARQLVLERARHGLGWLARYAPQDERFQIRAAPAPEVVQALGEDAVRALRALLKRLEACPWETEPLQEQTYEAARDADVPQGVVFKAAYLALVGQPKGPRLGPLLQSIGRERTLTLLRGATA